MEDNNHVKILFRFYSNILNEETTETIWATVVDEKKGLYQLDNIPFFAPEVAPGDLVFAEPDDMEKMLTFRKTVQYSENSVVQVVITSGSSYNMNDIRVMFSELGCMSESFNDRYLSMEVPALIDYKIVKSHNY